MTKPLDAACDNDKDLSTRVWPLRGLLRLISVTVLRSSRTTR